MPAGIKLRVVFPTKKRKPRLRGDPFAKQNALPSSPRIQSAKRNRTAGEREAHEGTVLRTALRRGPDLADCPSGLAANQEEGARCLIASGILSLRHPLN
jgi:hypothetical protein